ncbi:MAG: DNA polymerase III subunit delta' [Xanthomonadales bacterium]|nr:DNA polymerase III subunit delta' [Xanthomonadales bacterium]
MPTPMFTLKNNNYPWHAMLWQQLMKQHANQHLPHAILLSSQPHAGIEKLAERLAVRLICTELNDDSACGECRNCKLFAGGSHPDVFILEPEEDSKVIKIDQIREFVHKITLTASMASCKIALVRPAEAMNQAAANALLKTLEEPAGDAYIILSSTEPARLLATIRSRCQQYAVETAANTLVEDWLTQSGNQTEKVRTAILAARGLPLLAAEYLQGDLLDVRRNVGIGYLKTARGQADLMAVANNWVTLKQPLVWLWLSQWMGDVARASLTGEACKDPVSEAVRSARPNFPLETSLQLQSMAMQGWRSQEGPLRQDLLFEQWLLQWAQI